jgi:hypothetical protein
MADKIIPNLLNPEELRTYFDRLKQELVEKFTSNDLVQQIVKVKENFETFESRVKGYAIIGGLLYLLLLILLFFIIYLLLTNLKK